MQPNENVSFRNCRRCGTRSPHDQKFCRSCGKELGGHMALTEYLTPPGSNAAAAAEREKDMTQNLAYQHFLRAKQFIKQKNLLLAIREFERALEIHPEDPMVRRLLQKTREAHSRFGQKTPPVPRAAPAATAPMGGSVSEVASRGPAPASRAPAPMPRATVPPVAAAGHGSGPGPAPRVVASRAPAPRAAAGNRPVATPSPSRAAAPADVEAAGKRGAAPGAPRKAGAVAPQTGKFLEAYSKVPSMSLALLVEAETDDRVKELLVSLLILLGLFAFTTLLFV